jgi:hypothetical protein
VAFWENSELALGILSYLETTNNDQVFRLGLKLFIAMQETSLLLGEVLNARIDKLNEVKNVEE